jgi:hypothetical protein
MLPLDVLSLPPDLATTLPPVAAALSPALIDIEPPTDAPDDLPTDIRKSPLSAAAEDPVWIFMDPEVPDTLSPEATDTAPDPPAAPLPELAEDTETLPLGLPVPLDKATEPPVEDELLPAFILTSPPTSVDVPTLTNTAPPVACDTPVANLTEPEAEAATPVDMEMAPLLPAAPESTV